MSSAVLFLKLLIVLWIKISGMYYSMKHKRKDMFRLSLSLDTDRWSSGERADEIAASQWRQCLVWQSKCQPLFAVKAWLFKQIPPTIHNWPPWHSLESLFELDHFTANLSALIWAGSECPETSSTLQCLHHFKRVHKWIKDTFNEPGWDKSLM